jgi:hypothetical protein
MSIVVSVEKSDITEAFMREFQKVNDKWNSFDKTCANAGTTLEIALEFSQLHGARVLIKEIGIPDEDVLLSSEDIFSCMEEVTSRIMS